MPFVNQELIDQLRDTLLDPVVAPATDGRYWGNDELMVLINAGIADVCDNDEQAFVVTKSVALAAGAAQLVPGAAKRLQKVTRNMTDATSLAKPLARVRETDLDELDMRRPAWREQPPQKIVRQWAPNPADPRGFYVDPPSDGTGFVEEIYSGVPDDVAITDNFPLPDLYRDTVYEFVLWKAYGKNSKRGDVDKANVHRETYFKKVGIEDTEDRGGRRGRAGSVP